MSLQPLTDEELRALVARCDDSSGATQLFQSYSALRGEYAQICYELKRYHKTAEKEAINESAVEMLTLANAADAALDECKPQLLILIHSLTSALRKSAEEIDAATNALHHAHEVSHQSGSSMSEGWATREMTLAQKIERIANRMEASRKREVAADEAARNYSKCIDSFDDALFAAAGMRNGMTREQHIAALVAERDAALAHAKKLSDAAELAKLRMRERAEGAVYIAVNAAIGEVVRQAGSGSHTVEALGTGISHGISFLRSSERLDDEEAADK